MTPKSKQIGTWIGIVFGALGGLAIVGMAAAFWISIEVKNQLDPHTLKMVASIPDTAQITTDVEVIKGSIANIEANVNTALASQQRFEEIFTEYLITEANR